MILDSNFDDIAMEPLNEQLEKAIDQGARPIGYTCSYVPEVLLSVGDLVPVRLTACKADDTEMADIYLSNMLCSYVRSILEYAMDGRYDFLDGWVLTTGCSHLHRLSGNVEYLVKPDFQHLLDVPSITSPTAMKWYKRELEELRHNISEHFETDMSDSALSATIAEYNSQIAVMKEIGELRKAKLPLISGGEFHRLMMAWATMPRAVVAEEAKALRQKLERRNKKHDSRARIMMVGAQVYHPGLIDAIESQNAVLVADRHCTGSIPGLMPIDESKEPMDAINDHVFKRTACPSIQQEHKQRFEAVMRAVEEYAVDGIILEAIKFCDIWGYETTTMADALRDAGVPVLQLECNYPMRAEGQVQTRVQAFLESMGV